MIDISVIGQDELNKRLENVSNAVWFDSFIKDLAQSVFDDVEKLVGKHTKPTGSGQLERSLGSGAEKVGELNYVISSSGQIAPHNLFVHWGTRPHRIYPKDRKALRWVAGNKFMFAKFINHPGYAGDSFMVTASNNALRNFDSLVQKYTKEI